MVWVLNGRVSYGGAFASWSLHGRDLDIVLGHVFLIINSKLFWSFLRRMNGLRYVEHWGNSASSQTNTDLNFALSSRSQVPRGD